MYTFHIPVCENSTETCDTLQVWNFHTCMPNVWKWKLWKWIVKWIVTETYSEIRPTQTRLWILVQLIPIMSFP